jgi:AMP-polyphosphate phosphotransferase
MLEMVDLSRSLSKDQARKAADDLELRLGEAQRRLRELNIPLVIVFEGWDAAGKGTIINKLTRCLDPRGFRVHPTRAQTGEERLKPFLQRFWRELPAVGNIAIFDQSWYGRVLQTRVDGEQPETVWRQAYDEINAFERQLTADGCLIVKFWLHIDRKEQKRRFEKLLADPDFAWRVGPEERRRRKQWDEYYVAVEEMFERTSTGNAPWTVVEANCGRFALVKVMETILDGAQHAIAEAERKVARKAEPAPAPAEPPAGAVARSNPLDHIDLSKMLVREEYGKELDRQQERVLRLEHQIFTARTPVVIVYQGWDAAGKGGNIGRLTAGLDPRGYEVMPIGAPTADEKAHHWLRRFWIRLPKGGHITIFDRSWYERVMVERVEGFCTEDEWRRAYQEINEFEASLASFGTVIVKFWIHISPEEQLRRFEDRMNTDFKRWKITDEDWRNRDKWPQYYEAVGEMIQRTSTSYAPWTVIEGECKLWARVKACRVVADAMEAALD